jgi:hypothetical protein
MSVNVNNIKQENVHTSALYFDRTRCGTAGSQLDLLSFQPPNSRGSPNSTGVRNEGWGGDESESLNAAAFGRHFVRHWNMHSFEVAGLRKDEIQGLWQSNPGLERQ